MLINFKDIQVSVSGIPIMVENASFSYDSNLLPVHSIGYKNCVGYVNSGPNNYKLSLSYIMEVNKDPNFTGFFNYIQNRNIFGETAIPIVIGNISGMYYPVSFNIETNTPSDIIIGKIEYVSFSPVSGNLSESNPLNYNVSNNNDIAHLWNTKMLLDNNHAYGKSILDFSYSANINWEPQYTIGSIYPTKVLLLDGNENINLSTTIYNSIPYSGQLFSDYFNCNEALISI